MRLIDELRPKSGCDFIRAFAQQMQIAVFLAIVELPLADRLQAMAIVHRITRPDMAATRIKGFEELADYMMAKVAERRTRPGEV